jgi:hypothetical protein
MQKLKKLDDVVLSTPQLSALLGVSAQYIGRLRQQGVIEQVGPGQWLMLPTVPKLVEYRRTDRRRDVSSAMARLREAQLRRIEMANDERARRLIPYQEAQLALDVVVGFTRTELSALPMRYTRVLAEQRNLEAEIDGCLNRIAHKLEKEAATLRNGEG